MDYSEASQKLFDLDRKHNETKQVFMRLLKEGAASGSAGEFEKATSEYAAADEALQKWAHEMWQMKKRGEI